MASAAIHYYKETLPGSRPALVELYELNTIWPTMGLRSGHGTSVSLPKDDAETLQVSNHDIVVMGLLQHMHGAFYAVH